MGVPGALERIRNGTVLLIDGASGLVLLDPSPADLREASTQVSRRRKFDLELEGLTAEPCVTPDGRVIELLANVDLPEEIELAVRHGAQGVGLVRTEFLVTGRTSLPGENEQAEYFRRVASAFPDHPVTIRTFDLGGDKLPAGFRSHTENPALGLRAIRYCLRQPEMFRAQLRGLLRASVHGSLRLMFPMISGINELRAAKRVLAEVREELRREGQELPPVPVGIMIELPSAAMISDRLAAECDFFSIGTNDLIQYTIGIDRQNKDVAYLYKPLHLAVLRMLDIICAAGREAGIPVSMCGEMAGEPVNALVLVGLGVSELSMNGPSIPLVKRVIRAAKASDGRALVARLLALTTADDIEREVKTEMSRRFPGLLGEDAVLGPVGG
jgi:phosphotransferase system enzyme I (PtsI)